MSVVAERLSHRGNTGMFALCSVYRDASGKYVDVDQTDQLKCCLGACNFDVDACYGKCKSRSCKGKCDKLSVGCLQRCLQTVPSFSGEEKRTDDVTECIDKAGCGTFPRVNSKCVRQKRQSIIDCCQDTCISTKDLDCSKYCNMMTDFHMNDAFRIPPTKGGTPQSRRQPVRLQQLYYLLSILCLMLASLLYAWLCKRQSLIPS